MLAHQINHPRFIQAELRRYRFKCSSVLPGHFNNSGDAACRQCSRAGLWPSSHRKFHKSWPNAAARARRGHRSYTDIGIDFAVIREKQCADGLFFIRNQGLTSCRSKARSSKQMNATSIVSRFFSVSNRVGLKNQVGEGDFTCIGSLVLVFEMYTAIDLALSLPMADLNFGQMLTRGTMGVLVLISSSRSDIACLAVAE